MLRVSLTIVNLFRNSSFHHRGDSNTGSVCVRARTSLQYVCRVDSVDTAAAIKRIHSAKLVSDKRQ